MLPPSQTAAITLSAALLLPLLFRLLRKYSPFPHMHDTSAPVLCFGDSLTAGYFGVWHSKYAPKTPPNPNADEIDHVCFRPYSVRLGSRLAAASGLRGFEIHAGSALQFAETRAFSGWTAAQLLPRLQAALRGGPWRAVVLLAGTNDIVLNGDSPTVVAERLESLCDACDAFGVPVFLVVPPDCATDEHGLVPPERAIERRVALGDLSKKIRASARLSGRAIVDARRWIPPQVDSGSSLHEWSASFWDDSLHLSQKGSDALADLVFDALTGVAEQPSYRPNSKYFSSGTGVARLM